MNTWVWIAVWLVAPMVLGVGLNQPWLFGVVVLALVLWRWLPDPAVWLRSRGRKRALEDAVALNPHNSTARRDLSMIYLERKRPKRAVEILRDVQRDEVSAETEYLLGLALVDSGQHQEAIAPLTRALTLDPKLRYGDPHLALGRSHGALLQFDDAERAFSTFLTINSSSVEGAVRLAHIKRKRGQGAEAQAVLRGARQTYRLLPGFQRRRQRAWWLRSYLPF